jgi:hypothetical protein
MDLDPLTTMRRERAIEAHVLAPLQAGVEARIAILSARRLPSQRRQARVEELNGVLDLIETLGKEER